MLRFLRSPIEIKPADGDSSQAGYVVLEANQLSGKANKQRATRIEGETETVPAGMVLESIGYACCMLMCQRHTHCASPCNHVVAVVSGTSPCPWRGCPSTQTGTSSTT